MSSLKEILEHESSPRQTEESKHTIRLMRMGSFLRAYDWSAWLLKRQGSPLNVGLDSTGGSNHVFVGFPSSSAGKFMPEGCESRITEDGLLQEWIIPVTQFPPEDDTDRLDKEYEAWLKETTDKLSVEQEIKKQQKKKDPSGNTQRTERRRTDTDDLYADDAYSSAKPLRLTDIARQILQFQLHRHSPEECQKFIGQLQSEIMELL